jgi:hypothetical protein
VSEKEEIRQLAFAIKDLCDAIGFVDYASSVHVAAARKRVRDILRLSYSKNPEVDANYDSRSGAADDAHIEADAKPEITD